MTNNRTKILLMGSGLFVFSLCVCLLNGLFLPFSVEVYHYSRTVTWMSFIGMLGMSSLVFKCFDRMKESDALYVARKAGILYIGLMCCLYMILGYWMEYTPSGDNFMLYQASQTLAKEGHFETGSDFLLYFGRYSNQWGFLLFLTAVYRFLFTLGVQNTFYPIVFIQIVLYVLAFCSLFRIAIRLGGTKGKLRLIYLLVTCIPIGLAASVLYTDTYSMPFVIFTFEAVLHVLDTQKTVEQMKWSAIAGIMAFLGGQIKMTVLIVLIAAGIVWILRLPLRQVIMCIVISAGIVGIGTAGVHHYMLENILDPAIYKQEHTPVIHWIMMAIPSSDNPYGGYNSKDYAITWGMMDEGAEHSEVMNSIYLRMKDKIYSLRYPNRLVLACLRKNSASMSDGTFGMTEMLDDRPVRWNYLSEIVLEPGRWYRNYGAVVTGIWMAQLFISLYKVWHDLKNRCSIYSFLHIICFGIILFLMIWEARSRYLFGFVPVFLLLAALPPHKEDSIMTDSKGSEQCIT